MGLLSQMINSGSIEVEVEEPKVVEEEVTVVSKNFEDEDDGVLLFPTHFDLITPNGTIPFKVWDDTEEWRHSIDVSMCPEIYAQTARKFLYHWTSWLGNIIANQKKYHISIDLMNESIALFWRKMNELLIDYSPLRPNKYGFEVDPNIIISFKVLPPPLNNWIPGYVGEINPLEELFLKQSKSSTIVTLSVGKRS